MSMEQCVSIIDKHPLEERIRKIQNFGPMVSFLTVWTCLVFEFQI